MHKLRTYEFINQYTKCYSSCRYILYHGTYSVYKKKQEKMNLIRKIEKMLAHTVIVLTLIASIIAIVYATIVVFFVI